MHVERRQRAARTDGANALASFDRRHGATPPASIYISLSRVTRLERRAGLPPMAKPSAGHPPKLYLRAMGAGAKSDFEVVDGQQRLRTIWEFYRCSTPERRIRQSPVCVSSQSGVNSTHEHCRP